MILLLMVILDLGILADRPGTHTCYPKSDGSNPCPSGQICYAPLPGGSGKCTPDWRTRKFMDQPKEALDQENESLNLDLGSLGSKGFQDLERPLGRPFMNPPNNQECDPDASNDPCPYDKYCMRIMNFPEKYGECVDIPTCDPANKTSCPYGMYCDPVMDDVFGECHRNFTRRFEALDQDQDQENQKLILHLGPSRNFMDQPMIRDCDPYSPYDICPTGKYCIPGKTPDKEGECVDRPTCDPKEEKSMCPEDMSCQPVMDKDRKDVSGECIKKSTLEALKREKEDPNTHVMEWEKCRIQWDCSNAQICLPIREARARLCKDMDDMKTKPTLCTDSNDCSDQETCKINVLNLPGTCVKKSVYPNITVQPPEWSTCYLHSQCAASQSCVKILRKGFRFDFCIENKNAMVKPRWCNGNQCRSSERCKILGKNGKNEDMGVCVDEKDPELIDSCKTDSDCHDGKYCDLSKIVGDSGTCQLKSRGLIESSSFNDQNTPEWTPCKTHSNCSSTQFCAWIPELKASLCRSKDQLEVKPILCNKNEPCEKEGEHCKIIKKGKPGICVIKETESRSLILMNPALCKQNVDCKEGEYCHREFRATGTCQPKPAKGWHCEEWFCINYLNPFPPNPLWSPWIHHHRTLFDESLDPEPQLDLINLLSSPGRLQMRRAQGVKRSRIGVHWKDLKDLKNREEHKKHQDNDFLDSRSSLDLINLLFPPGRLQMRRERGFKRSRIGVFRTTRSIETLCQAARLPPRTEPTWTPQKSTSTRIQGISREPRKLNFSSSTGPI